MMTEFNEIFSGRQPHQDVKVFGHFRDWLCPQLQGVAGGLVEPKLLVVLPNHQQHLEDGDRVSF
jgi:hypothetical protein